MYSWFPEKRSISCLCVILKKVELKVILKMYIICGLIKMILIKERGAVGEEQTTRRGSCTSGAAPANRLLA